MKKMMNKNNIIIVINGVGTSGKGKFVEFCNQLNHKIMNTSMVNYAKSIARYADWDGAKTEKDRLMLSNIKDALDEWNDCSFKNVSKYISACKNKIIFIDSREPKDLQRLKKEFNAITLLVRNNRVPNITTNHADKDVENFEYDYIIENNGSLEDLKDSAETFLKEISNG